MIRVNSWDRDTNKSQDGDFAIFIKLFINNAGAPFAPRYEHQAASGITSPQPVAKHISLKICEIFRGKTEM